MIKKTIWILFGFLAVSIGLYPAIYFIVDRNFGLLSTKSEALLTDLLWNTGFYTHIIFGGLAMLTGWLQFSPRLRRTHLSLHRGLGKIYVVSALLSGFAGIGIGTQATGGLTAALGFMSLGIVWVYTTFTAYRHIRAGRVTAHQKMMTYSYAACFGAVMLRLWMPLLVTLSGDFITAYRIVAWLCWVPNVGVAWWVNRRMHDTNMQLG
ncbi:MAG: DUF2306 domain-containing protein [Haliscomenobacteraceae bacterium CHB4]|nr:hypothetical protein [Saprospiraceae bacterium]MCE7924912.1 DUF2306 domain-containing protein [Haliscomenobacteraceae bacterium CHB4]